MNEEFLSETQMFEPDRTGRSCPVCKKTISESSGACYRENCTMGQDRPARFQGIPTSSIARKK